MLLGSHVLLELGKVFMRACNACAMMVHYRSTLAKVFPFLAVRGCLLFALPLPRGMPLWFQQTCLRVWVSTTRLERLLKRSSLLLARVTVRSTARGVLRHLVPRGVLVYLDGIREIVLLIDNDFALSWIACSGPLQLTSLSWIVACLRKPFIVSKACLTPSPIIHSLPLESLSTILVPESTSGSWPQQAGLDELNFGSVFLGVEGHPHNLVGRGGCLNLALIVQEIDWSILLFQMMMMIALWEGITSKVIGKVITFLVEGKH